VFILQCQKKSENLSDLNKKDRNKRHSSPFINVVKGVFLVVRVTLVPVSYLSAPSAEHSYRVPGKFIRRLKSLFVYYEKFIRLVRIKQKFIHIAYLYSKCTDCRINNIYKLQKHDLLRHQSYLIVFMGNKNLRFGR
jgi:hypothetical protein